MSPRGFEPPNSASSRRIEICIVTLKGQIQNLTSGQGHVVTQVGHIAYESMHLDETHLSHITLASLSLLNQKLFPKTVGELR